MSEAFYWRLMFKNMAKNDSYTLGVIRNDLFQKIHRFSKETSLESSSGLSYKIFGEHPLVPNRVLGIFLLVLNFRTATEKCSGNSKFNIIRALNIISARTKVGPSLPMSITF